MFKKRIIGNKELLFNQINHTYSVDGIIYPSVTTITGQLDKSGPLMGWALKESMESLRNNVYIESDSNCKLDTSKIDAIIKKAKRRPFEIKDTSSDIGIRLHKLIENDIKGEQCKINGGVQYLYDNYEEWKNTFKSFKPIDAEIMTYSDIRCPYAGTADFLAELNGKLTLGDIKTGNNIYESYIAQLAAYKFALETTNGYKIKQTGILQLKTDGNYNWVTYSSAHMKYGLQIFFNLCKLYIARNNLNNL